jgi:hypothetical protein
MDEVNTLCSHEASPVRVKPLKRTPPHPTDKTHVTLTNLDSIAEALKQITDRQEMMMTAIEENKRMILEMRRTN